MMVAEWVFAPPPPGIIGPAMVMGS